MLKALALLARRGDALIVPSAVAPTATEPGACSSPRLPPCWCTPGVLSTMVLGHGRCGCGFWRRSRAADSRCRSAGEICATGDRVVPWAADPSWDCDPTRIASSKRPPPPARQTRPASAEYVAQLAKAPAFTERLQRPPRRRRRPRFTRVVGCMAVRTMALPRRRRLSPRVHHITTTSPPPARRQPTHTRIELTCILTAHITQSRHRLPHAARFHSNARAPADTFLLPARSPRKTRPSRHPPRSARPLVRPTSFMRTTTPRSPPAKALRMMSRLRCAQSLHCTNAGKMQPAACRSSLPRGRVWPPRHDRPCLHPLRGMSTPCTRPLRMSSGPSDGTLQSVARRCIRARRPPRRSPRRPPNRTRRTQTSSPRSMANLDRSASTTSATHRPLLPSR